jgi:hypothetical protein
MTMLGLAFLLLAAQPAGGCVVSVSVRSDDSFAQAGYDSSSARLGRLTTEVQERFAAAAHRLCANGKLRPEDLASFRELIVQNGEGATEPVLYRELGMKARAYFFQFAFQNGGPPEPAAFEEALLCWKHPRSCEPGD